MSGAADAGLITLEWLLIVGAIAGLAASSVLVVQRVVDDTSEAPVDPLVRLLEADIEAAFVASDAQAAFDAALSAGLTFSDTDFANRCHPGIRNNFPDVVASATWIPRSNGPDGMEGGGDDVPARCVVRPAAGLGG